MQSCIVGGLFKRTRYFRVNGRVSFTVWLSIIVVSVAALSLCHRWASKLWHSFHNWNISQKHTINKKVYHLNMIYFPWYSSIRCTVQNYGGHFPLAKKIVWWTRMHSAHAHSHSKKWIKNLLVWNLFNYVFMAHIPVSILIDT